MRSTDDPSGAGRPVDVNDPTIALTMALLEGVYAAYQVSFTNEIYAQLNVRFYLLTLVFNEITMLDAPAAADFMDGLTESTRARPDATQQYEDVKFVNKRLEAMERLKAAFNKQGRATPLFQSYIVQMVHPEPKP